MWFLSFHVLRPFISRTRKLKKEAFFLLLALASFLFSLLFSIFFFEVCSLQRGTGDADEQMRLQREREGDMVIMA